MKRLLRALLLILSGGELPGDILQYDLVQVYRQATLFALACQVLDNGDRDGLPNVLVEAGHGDPGRGDGGLGDSRARHARHQRLPRATAFTATARGLHAHADRGWPLRSRMAQEGRHKVLAEFDLERNTRRVLSLFQETLGPRPVDAAMPPTPPASSGLARQDGSF